MSTTERRPRPAVRPSIRSRAAVTLVVALLSVVACGSSPSTPTGSTSDASQAPSTASAGAPSGSASLPSAAEPSPSLAPSPSLTTQTDTDWGRIWDAVPAGFPRFPDATTAEDAAPEPVSAAYAVGGTDAGEIATWMQSALESATYSTEALSGPLEDRGYVLDSVGDGDCRLETKITPQGTLVIVTVRYGAACPAP